MPKIVVKGKGIRLPKTISHKQFLEIVNAVKFDNKAKERKIKTAFILGFYQCMRVSEISNLDDNDIDTERGFIHILSGKGGKDADIPIQEPTKKFLKYVPIGYSPRTLQREFNHWSEKVLGTKYNFHSLRHSGATFYIKQGINIRYVQALLRHSRITTTEIYTHVTPDAMSEVYNKLWNNLEEV